MAKTKADANSETKHTHYSRLIINKAMRASFVPVFIVLFGTVGFMVFQVNIRGESWMALILPLLSLAVLCCMFPMTEEWEYKPWQSQPERYERVTDK